MKTMTCKELGGVCDARITAATWGDMVGAITTHVMQNHPDLAKKMEQMHSDDPRKWGNETRPKWDAATED